MIYSQMREIQQLYEVKILPKNATSGTYLFEANNGNIRSIREIYSELTIKTLEKRQ